MLDTITRVQMSGTRRLIGLFARKGKTTKRTREFTMGDFCGEPRSQIFRAKNTAHAAISTWN